jgi:alpha-beta hydrolase superfamily lysophospholipase
MKSRDYWLNHYVTATDPGTVAQVVERTSFTSGGRRFELVCFSASRSDPNILISQGSGGHAYVFAELAYHLHLAGYNVFIMPKQGGYPIDELLVRHRDALHHIASQFNDTIGVYSEGLGGYVSFYLALAHAPMGSLVCENSPAILTEPAYQKAVMNDAGPWARTTRRRRVMMPVLRPLARIAPRLKVPISSYLSWKDIIDPRQDVERRLVLDGYLKDPDFDRWYPLSAALSLMTTPLPGPLDGLTTPTMFIVASLGPTPDYITDLYQRLPVAQKKLVPIDGSVYWMLSHPREAATLIDAWFATSLTSPGPASNIPGTGTARPRDTDPT